MISLEESRNKIDEIDDKLIRLFEERMETVADVAEYKKDNGIEIFQVERENQVIEKNVAKIKNKDLDIYAREFFKDLMKVSKTYQADRIGKK